MTRSEQINRTFNDDPIGAHLALNAILGFLSVEEGNQDPCALRILKSLDIFVAIYLPPLKEQYAAGEEILKRQ